MTTPAEVLDHTARTFAYNSVSPLIERATGTFRRDMGGSCAQQLRHVRSLLCAIGVEMNFLRAGNGSVHYVGIANSEKETLFFDPSKGQKFPLSVSDLFRDGSPISSEAFPTNARIQRLITLVQTGETTFDERITTYNQRTGPEGKTDIESFDVENLTRNPPDSELDCRLACDSKSIQMVAVLKDEDVATMKIDAKRISLRMLGEAPTRSVAESKGIFRAIAESCGVSSKELRQYLHLGYSYLSER